MQTREAATRNRHTRRREQPGEEGGDPHSPWHSEQRQSDPPQWAQECSCPQETCGSGSGSVPPPPPPQPSLPRLLYSLKESRVVQRALDLSDPRLVNLLTYASSPSALCPAVLGSAPAAVYPPAALPGGVYPMPEYLPQRMVAPSSPGWYPTSAPYPDCGARQCPHHAASNPQTLLITSNGTPVCVHNAAGQVATVEGESRARSVCQQTDGNPVEEDLDMPRHATFAHHHHATATAAAAAIPQAGHNPAVQAQHVPPRGVAPNPAVPSPCGNSGMPCPAQSFPPPAAQYPSAQPGLVYQGPQGAVYAAPGPAQHHRRHCQPCQGPPSAAFGNPSALAQAQLQPLTYYQHSAAHQMMAPSQQQAIPLQQQPVVQQPSDSSMSQDSSELSQEGRQRDGGHSNSSQAASQCPDVLPQEGMLLRQDQFGARCTYAYPSPSPRAITDYAHNDYPWRGPSSLHNYQPTPVYVIGIQGPDSHHLHHHHPPSSWPGSSGMYMPPSPMATPAGLFMPPSPTAMPGDLFASSAAGMFASAHPGMFAPPSHGQMFVNHFQNPYSPFMYPQAPMVPETKPMAFNPNFNLSNSNPHVFVQHPPSAHFVPECSPKIRVVASDAAGNGPTHVSAATWTSEEAVLSSDRASRRQPQQSKLHVAVQAEVSASEPAEAFQAPRAVAAEQAVLSRAELKAPDMLHAEAAAAEPTNVFQAELATSQPTVLFQDAAVSTELMNVFRDEVTLSNLTEMLHAEMAATEAMHLAPEKTNTVPSCHMSAPRNDQVETQL